MWDVRMMRWRFVILIVSFVAFSVIVLILEKPLFAPKRQGHQTRHVKRGAGCCNRSHDPNNPAHRNKSGRGRAPENLVFGPEAAKRNDAANRQPTGEERPVGVGHVLLSPPMRRISCS